MPRNFLLPLIIMLSVPLAALAQFTSPHPHGKVATQYTINGSRDTVFVFNLPQYGEIDQFTITTLSPDTTDGWVFRWHLYNEIVTSYTLFHTTTGVSSSIDTITSKAGYMVIRNKGSVADTVRVWMVINDFDVRITSKGGDNTIPNLPVFMNCNLIKLVSQHTPAQLHYYRPGSDSAINLPNSYAINWTKSGPEGSLPQRRFGDAYVNDPPVEDTWYTLNVTDSYDLLRSDSVKYISIVPRAQMKTEYIPRSDFNHYPAHYQYTYFWDKDKGLGTKETPAPGPAKFKFMNSDSKNAKKFYWVFGDGNDERTIKVNDTLVHEYLKPGKYEALLVAYGPDSSCTDTFRLEEPIHLSNAYIGTVDSLIFPNVFTPNSDGFEKLFTHFEQNGMDQYLDNNLFRGQDVSIYDFSIVIFSRAGKKVHQYHGNIRDWKGWDGKVMRSNRDATEGVYYYVVDFVQGYEADEKGNVQIKKFDKKQQIGFVHLFRDK